ncbi:MAG: hypothetical protein HY598_00010 [Candidatus Omnitrophica bacterium]|nr:hypothetical protein [Candidatus Omnitrophota bacterium]
MNQRQIDRFFRLLARELNRPCRVIVTGAAAGSLWGSIRPSLDIDFSVTFVPARRRQWDALEAAIARTVAATGIKANYAEDIDRWGQISLLDYRRTTQPYKRFGALEVRLIDPAYWTIGKLTRYLDPDVEDLVTVLRRQRITPGRLADLWGRALRLSPRSNVLTQFRRQAEHFLQTYGKAIWGPTFHADRILTRLYRRAGLHP